MPTYPYKCSKNPEHTYEEVRSISTPAPENLTCTEEGCDGRMVRVFSAPPIKFQGGGWSTKESWR